MDDLSGMISQVLSDPEKLSQIQAVAASLGLGASGPAATPEHSSPEPVHYEPPAPAASLPAVSSSGPDLSALSGLLGGLGGNGGNSNTPDLSALSALLGGLGGNGGSSNTPDLSALSGILSGLSGSGGVKPGAGGGNGFDVGALAGLLRTGNPAPGPGPASGGFDISTLLKLQQAMANVQTNRANIDLLLALKPRLSERRAKKVDDAIRVMQLIQFLPLLKETGLFGEMDSILSGLGEGFGSILGGLGGTSGGGLGSILSSLVGGQRRGG